MRTLRQLAPSLSDKRDTLSQSEDFALGNYIRRDVAFGGSANPQSARVDKR